MNRRLGCLVWIAAGLLSGYGLVACMTKLVVERSERLEIDNRPTPAPPEPEAP